MSVFQIEDHIIINSGDDLCQRSNYESNFKPKNGHIKSVAAIYAFKDETILCSVSDCHQAHSKGYLVNIINGKESNICEACGKRFLGTQFKDQKRIFQNQETLRQQKIRLNKILKDDINKKRVFKLKESPKGANWFYQVFTSFCDTYPIELLKALNELASNRDDNAVIQQLIDQNASVSQIETVKGIQGLGIFQSDIREELIGKILKPLIELQKLTDTHVEKVSLTRYCKWADGLDDQFDHVEYLIEEGQAFFNTWNQERLKSIPLSKRNAQKVRTLSWNSDRIAKNTSPR